MSNIYLRNGDTWKTVSGETNVWIKVAGEWLNVAAFPDEVFVKVNGVWKVGPI